MADETAESQEPQDPTPASQLDPAVLAAIREAVAAGLVAAPLAGPPPAPALTMVTTPILGLKQPALDDPALITDLNDNFTILDGAITASVAATLYNKTLEAPVINNPTITGWGNANHTHLNAASAGGLDGAAITSGYLGTGLLLREGAPGGTLLDPIIRDELLFAPDPTGAPDASLKRTGPGALRADTHLGVGNPGALKPWGTAQRAIQVGEVTALYDVGGYTNLASNSYEDAGGPKAFINLAASKLVMNSGATYLYTAPAVAAGAAQTFTARAQFAPTGTLTLTPDAGQSALAVGQAAVQLRQIVGPAADHLYYTPAGGYANIFMGNGANRVYIDGNGNTYPATSGGANCGLPGQFWNAIYALTGTIQTSLAAAKERLTPLSPAECYQAAKDVVWYEYRYLPPAYQEPEPQEGVTPEQHQQAVDEGKAAHARMLVETAPARHQRGFVFPDAEGVAKDELGGALPPVPDLFGLSDRQSTTPQADLATLGCAMQEIIRRLEAVEAAQAPTGTTTRRRAA